MATERGFFQRMTALVDWQGPNRSATPEDDSPAELQAVYSRSGETFIIPGAYLNTIAQNSDSILVKEGAQDLKLYDNILDDDVAFSCFQQRRLAVVSHDWEVAAGDDQDPRSVEAADHLRLQLKQLSFDRICNLMLFSVWHGYSVGECIWKVGPDGKIWLDDIIVPDRRWFAFTETGELRFSPTLQIMGGAKVPPNKFWTIRTGANHDFAFYGLGLGHWCYWPVWFKRNVVKFWVVYLEKLGFPTVMGAAETTWSDTEKTEFMTALVAIGRDRAVRVPADAYDRVKVIEGTRNATGSSGYSDFVTEQNEALMRIILGQPGTSKATAQGVGGKQSEVHEDVKGEIVKADSDLLSESFIPAKWLTRWNFGEDVAPPRVYRILDKGEDVNDIAERDVKLDGIGIKRTEKSVADVYGDGYELVEVETPPALVPGAVPPVAANDDDKREDLREAFAARDVAPLYVYRKVKNARELLSWARSQGIKNLVKASELHVTCLYSKTPVDWFNVSEGWSWQQDLEIVAGGPRKVEALGEGAVVLRFKSTDLEYQHADKVRKGASHDFPEYLPHITLSYDPQVELETVDAYNGKIDLGPEIFEEINLDFAAQLDNLDFSVGESDAIDRIARAMAEETNPILLNFAAELAKSVEGIESAEGMRIALLETFERMPVRAIAESTGLPLLAERLASLAGAEEKVDV